MDGRADDAVQAVGRGRLDREGAQTRIGGRGDGLDLLLAGHDVVAEPGGQLVSIPHAGLAEAEGGADLRAMVLDRAAGPVILEVVFVGDADLRGDMGDNGAGDLVAMAREPPFMLEVEEQDGEAQARGAVLAGQERLVAREQCPLLNQLVGVPLALHRSLPSRSQGHSQEVPSSDGVGTQDVAESIEKALPTRKMDMHKVPETAKCRTHETNRYFRVRQRRGWRGRVATSRAGETDGALHFPRP